MSRAVSAGICCVLVAACAAASTSQSPPDARALHAATTHLIAQNTRHQVLPHNKLMM